VRTLPDLDKKNKTKENGGEAPLLQQPPPFARDNPKKADIYAPTPMMPSFGSCAIRRCERKKNSVMSCVWFAEEKKTLA